MFGLPAGALLALPVALRNVSPGVSTGLVWLAATGLLSIAVALCAGLLRMARPLPSAVPIVPMGVVFALGPLTFLGTALHAHTHHRPLGAATFAVLSVALLLGCFALAARARACIASSDSGKRLFGRALFYGTIAFSLALGLRGFVVLLGTAKAHATYLAPILDGLLGVSLSLVGGFIRFTPKLEQVARIGGPLSMLACVLALLVALKDTHTSAALAQCLSLWAIL